MAINIFAIGATAYLVSAIFGQPGASPQVAGLRDESLLTWVAVALVVGLHIFLYRTRVGAHLRAVGEEPRAAATAGINVVAYRYAATMAGGALAALGGAYLSVGETDIYSDGMVAGRGFIALAAVIFGKWTPFGAAGACVFFARSSRVSNWRCKAPIDAGLQPVRGCCQRIFLTRSWRSPDSSAGPGRLRRMA